MFSFIKTATKNKQRVIILAVIGGIASSAALLSNLFLGPDNPVEEASEKIVDEVIEETTGIHTDIDFTPGK